MGAIGNLDQGMKRLVITFVLVLSSSILFAQTLKTHTGKVSVGDYYGTETYSYYLDDYGHEIRHGKYTYSGVYKDTYAMGNIINTDNITVSATYSHGMYNGVFTQKETHRIEDMGVTTNSWEEYSVTFKDGEPSGPFSQKKMDSNGVLTQTVRTASSMKGALGLTYFNGSLDSKGYATGRWTIKTKYKEYVLDMLNGYAVSTAIFENDHDHTLIYKTDQIEKMTATKFAKGEISFNELIKQNYFVFDSNGGIFYEKEDLKPKIYRHFRDDAKNWVVRSSDKWLRGFICKANTIGNLENKCINMFLDAIPGSCYKEGVDAIDKYNLCHLTSASSYDYYISRNKEERTVSIVCPSKDIQSYIPFPFDLGVINMLGVSFHVLFTEDWYTDVIYPILKEIGVREQKEQEEKRAREARVAAQKAEREAAKKAEREKERINNFLNLFLDNITRTNDVRNLVYGENNQDYYYWTFLSDNDKKMMQSITPILEYSILEIDNENKNVTVQLTKDISKDYLELQTVTTKVYWNVNDDNSMSIDFQKSFAEMTPTKGRWEIMKEKQGLIEQLNENNITAASTYAPDIAKNLKQYWKLCDYNIKSDLDESEERINKILQIEQNFKEAVDLRKSISQKDDDIRNRLSQYKNLKKVYSSYFKSVDLSYNYTESTDKLTSISNTLDEFLITLDGERLSAYESIVAKDKSTTPAQWFSKNGEDSELLLIEKMRSLTTDAMVVVSKQHDPVVTIIKKDEEEAKTAEEVRLAAQNRAEEAKLTAEEKTAKEASKDAKKTDVSQIVPETKDTNGENTELFATGENTIIRKGSQLYDAATGKVLTASDFANPSLWQEYEKGSKLMKTGNILYIAGGASLVGLFGLGILDANVTYITKKPGNIWIAGFIIGPACAITGMVMRLSGKSTLNHIVQTSNGQVLGTLSVGPQPNGFGLAYIF